MLKVYAIHFHLESGICDDLRIIAEKHDRHDNSYIQRVLKKHVEKQKRKHPEWFEAKK